MALVSCAPTQKKKKPAQKLGTIAGQTVLPFPHPPGRLESHNQVVRDERAIRQN